jgi:hypothetical protein
MMQPTLAATIAQTFIIAYQECTDPLEQCLNQEGLSCQVLRQVHRPEYKNYASSYLCFLNHFESWILAAQRTKPTLMVEADFVPVIGMGNLPSPLDPERSDAGLAWLYTCAAQLYSVSAKGYAIGFSTAAVAYMVTPIAAQHLLNFAQEIIAQTNPTQYTTWDSEIEGFLRRQGFSCYVPFRNYGEHGGKPNPEHKKAGLGSHRADVLFAPLAFCPLYAQKSPNPQVILWKTRLDGRLKGLLRLLLGRYLRWKILFTSSTPGQMLRFAIGRQLTLKI